MTPLSCGAAGVVGTTNAEFITKFTVLAQVLQMTNTRSNRKPYIDCSQHTDISNKEELLYVNSDENIHGTSMVLSNVGRSRPFVQLLYLISEELQNNIDTCVKHVRFVYFVYIHSSIHNYTGRTSIMKANSQACAAKIKVKISRVK